MYLNIFPTNEFISFSDETEIAQAKNVLKFARLKTYKSGLSGTLFITNYKVSFVTASLHVDSRVSLSLICFKMYILFEETVLK